MGAAAEIVDDLKSAPFYRRKIIFLRISLSELLKGRPLWKGYDLTLRIKSVAENVISVELNSCHGHFHFPSFVCICMEMG
jgi:hypothetical protein